MEGDSAMLFEKGEYDLYEFYETLEIERRDEVDRRLRYIIPELRKNGVDEGDIYHLQCTVAKEIFGRA